MSEPVHRTPFPQDCLHLQALRERGPGNLAVVNVWRCPDCAMEFLPAPVVKEQLAELFTGTVTLRDRLAMAAMGGDLSCQQGVFQGNKATAAEFYYAMADAMLEARKK